MTGHSRAGLRAHDNRSSDLLTAVMTTAEVEAVYGVKADTVKKALQQKRLAGRKSEDVWLVEREDVLAMWPDVLAIDDFNPANTREDDGRLTALIAEGHAEAAAMRKLFERDEAADLYDALAFELSAALAREQRVRDMLAMWPDVTLHEEK